MFVVSADSIPPCKRYPKEFPRLHHRQAAGQFKLLLDMVFIALVTALLWGSWHNVHGLKGRARSFFISEVGRPSKPIRIWQNAIRSISVSQIALWRAIPVGCAEPGVKNGLGRLNTVKWRTLTWSLGTGSSNLFLFKGAWMFAARPTKEPVNLVNSGDPNQKESCWQNIPLGLELVPFLRSRIAKLGLQDTLKG